MIADGVIHGKLIENKQQPPLELVLTSFPIFSSEDIESVEILTGEMCYNQAKILIIHTKKGSAMKEFTLNGKSVRRRRGIELGCLLDQVQHLCPGGAWKAHSVDQVQHLKLDRVQKYPRPRPSMYGSFSSVCHAERSGCIYMQSAPSVLKYGTLGTVCGLILISVDSVWRLSLEKVDSLGNRSGVLVSARYYLRSSDTDLPSLVSA